MLQRRFRNYSNLDMHLWDLEADSVTLVLAKSFANYALGGVTREPVSPSVVFSMHLESSVTQPERVQKQTARMQRAMKRSNLSAAIRRSFEGGQRR